MNSKSTPRLLQQQPDSGGERKRQQQQSSGGQESSKRAAPKKASQHSPQQMGEGSYEASEDYQKRIQSYLEKADVKADAEAAKPSGQAEAHEMEAAEKEGLSHSKARGQ